MYPGDADKLNKTLSRIADSLERIENHLGGEKPKNKQKVVVNCGNCKGTGLYKYPFDSCETNCIACSGKGQVIKIV